MFSKKHYKIRTWVAKAITHRADCDAETQLLVWVGGAHLTPALRNAMKSLDNFTLNM